MSSKGLQRSRLFCIGHLEGSDCQLVALRARPECKMCVGKRPDTERGGLSTPFSRSLEEDGGTQTRQTWSDAAKPSFGHLYPDPW